MKRWKELQGVKEQKQSIWRGIYAILPNFWYFYRQMCRFDRWNRILFVSLPLSGWGIRYLYSYIPKLMLQLVTEQSAHEKLLLFLFAAVMAQSLFYWLQWNGAAMINNKSLAFKHHLQERILTKICSTAYADLENPEYIKKFDRSKELYERWDRDAQACVFTMSDFLEFTITILCFSAILSMVHPLVVVAIVSGNVVQYVTGQKIVQWQEQNRNFWQPIELKIDYIVKKIKDFSYAKEMRLYQGENWLLPKYQTLLKQRKAWRIQSVRQEQYMQFLASLTNLVVQGIVYLCLLRDVLRGTMEGADFVWYLSMILGLNTALNGMLRVVKEMKQQAISIADYRQMLRMPDSNIRGEEEGKLQRAPQITFSQVSFRYPQAEQATLKQIDFTIHAGEKIAIVGLNGAGKSTLIKLLSGMYEPTEGEIRIDGKPIQPWSLNSYYQLFSVVFQDLDVMPATILENVAVVNQEKANRGRVEQCLKQAGLWELIQTLPKGMDTPLKKEFFEDGVNVSGGELQKILLARAIYKEAPILILDEPTAALDAIAENQLYLKYNELTENRTSIFISHRLSSTQFCDRIFMMQDGEIIEVGSHQQLMSRKGAYARLYQLQSHYYQKDRTESFASTLDADWEVSRYVSE